MSLNLNALKYFCDAVKLGGVSAAAKANFVTQSAISQGITKLEKSLGIALVAHHPNRFRLTPDGETVFQKGLEILRNALEFKESISKDHMGSLDFACTYSFAVAVIPKYLKKFQADFPRVNVNFYLGKNTEIKQMLKSGLIDFGIGPEEEDLKGWERKTLHKGKFGLFVSSKTSEQEQNRLGFILAEADCNDTIFFKKTYQRKFGYLPKVALEVSSWEVMANLTAEGLGIGYFPDFVSMNKQNCFRMLDLKIKMFDYCITAFSPHGMKLRKSSQAFLSYFETRLSA